LLGVALALGAVVIPCVYVLTRRMIGKVRQRETEDRRSCRQESDIEILGRAPSKD